MPSSNTTFDDDEILQILLKKSFQVPSTYEGTAWYDESTGKSLTILESTDINVEKIPTSPIWNNTPLTSSELSSYGIELGSDDNAVSYNFASTSSPTSIEAYDGTTYSTSVSFNPGAYIDSTGVVMLFIRLKLDVMVLSETSAIAYVKYPTDTSDNSILDNAFQFNFNLQTNVTPDISEFKPFFYKLEYGTSFRYLTQDKGNWSFDFKSGILVFSDDPATGDSTIDLNSGDLYFTFVKYVGPRGLDKLISVDASFDSTDIAGYYENQIVVDSSNSEIYLMKDGSWNSIGGGGGGAFTIDGTNAYYNSGNVGIGTSSPSSILDVSGNANISSDLTVSGDLIIGSSSINVDTKLGELDTSVNLVETSVSNLNISVNSLETITTKISYNSGTTTIDGSANINGSLKVLGGNISGSKDGNVALVANAQETGYNSAKIVLRRDGGGGYGAEILGGLHNNTSLNTRGSEDLSGTEFFAINQFGGSGSGRKFTLDRKQGAFFDSDLTVIGDIYLEGESRGQGRRGGMRGVFINFVKNSTSSGKFGLDSYFDSYDTNYSGRIGDAIGVFNSGTFTLSVDGIYRIKVICNAENKSVNDTRIVVGTYIDITRAGTYIVDTTENPYFRYNNNGSSFGLIYLRDDNSGFGGNCSYELLEELENGDEIKIKTKIGKGPDNRNYNDEVSTSAMNIWCQMTIELLTTTTNIIEPL